MKKHFYFITDKHSRLEHTELESDQLLSTGDYAIVSDSKMMRLITHKKKSQGYEPQYKYGGRKAGYKRCAVAEYHGG